MTDLLCQSMMTGASSDILTPKTTRAFRPSSGHSMSRSRVSSPLDQAKLTSSHSTVSLLSRHRKSFSAPVPMSFTVNGIVGIGEEEQEGGGARKQTPPMSARSRSEGGSCQAGMVQYQCACPFLIWVLRIPIII